MKSWQIAILIDGASFLTLFIACSCGWIKTNGKMGNICVFIIALLLLYMILPITMN